MQPLDIDRALLAPLRTARPDFNVRLPVLPVCLYPYPCMPGRAVGRPIRHPEAFVRLPLHSRVNAL